ncbi:MAG: YSIRK-type signal peptide-containing protein [Streptococcus sp.]
MRDMFNKRQHFSLRKYSFGVASVLLGVSIFSNAQGAQADETVAPATTGMATTAEPDVVVEQSTPAAASTAPTTTENAPSSVSTVALASEQPQSAAPASQATSTSQTAASSEVASHAASQASSESATAQATSVATSAQALSSTAATEAPVAGQVSAQTTGAATSVAAATEATSTESKAVNSALKVATSELAVTSSELNAAEASLNSENLINAMGLAVANRDLRPVDALTVLTNAGAGSTNPDLTNLGYKLNYLPERQQYFVNIDYINHLKVGRDNDGVMRAYDYIDDATGRYVVVVNYANLGIIDYVDEAGNKIPNSSTYRINNSTETITANGKTYNKIYDAGITELPPVPAGYRIKYASADKSRANAYVDVLKVERQYDYVNGIATIRSNRSWA